MLMSLELLDDAEMLSGKEVDRLIDELEGKDVAIMVDCLLSDNHCFNFTFHNKSFIKDSSRCNTYVYVINLMNSYSTCFGLDFVSFLSNLPMLINKKG